MGLWERPTTITKYVTYFDTHRSIYFSASLEKLLFHDTFELIKEFLKDISEKILANKRTS